MFKKIFRFIKYLFKRHNKPIQPILVLDVDSNYIRVTWLKHPIADRKVLVQVPSKGNVDAVIIWVDKYNNYFFEDQLKDLDEKISAMKGDKLAELKQATANQGLKP